MHVPVPVLIHNQILGLKGTEGKLLQITELGYYEVECRFGDGSHRVLLPIESTVIISQEPEEESGPQIEVDP